MSRRRATAARGARGGGGGSLLLLCCWPGPDRSDSSSNGYPSNLEIADISHGRDFGDALCTNNHRETSSHASLCLPGTSSHDERPVLAHRSHEEIRSRRKSHFDSGDEETRYHSAPSVIDEVLHRRDWERPERGPRPPAEPRARQGQRIPLNVLVNNCKKHYTNIKSSAKKQNDSLSEKEKCRLIEKNDAEKVIGGDIPANDDVEYDTNETSHSLKEERRRDDTKRNKQCINESIRAKDKTTSSVKLNRLEEDALLEGPLGAGEAARAVPSRLDRSGAEHRDRAPAARTPLSVEPVDYEGGACYLAEAEARAAGAGAAGGWLRARHASDGDILAPCARPESGAFSESDLDWELEACDEPPPPYADLRHYEPRRETAI